MAFSEQHGENFIAKAKARHVNTDGTPIYGYDEVEYVDRFTKVNIWCPIHSEHFSQTPKDHLGGSGCPKCGDAKKNAGRGKTMDEWLAEARAMHGDRYDYSQVVYTGRHCKVDIICSEHGVFSQYSKDHLRGSNCPKCATTAGRKLQVWNTGILKEKLREIYGSKYDYSEVVYVAYDKPVRMRCLLHGTWLAFPSNLLKPGKGGRGCPVCGRMVGGEINRYTRTEFIAKAQAIHTNSDGTPRYDYSQVDYVNSHKHVDVICKEHGVFKVIPGNHVLNGGRAKGCPHCGAKQSFLAVNGDKPTELYVVELTNAELNQRFIKVGITSRKLSIRMSEIKSCGYLVKVIYSEAFSDPGEAFECELMLKRKYEKYRASDVSDVVEPEFAGWKTESFQADMDYQEIIDSIRGFHKLNKKP